MPLAIPARGLGWSAQDQGTWVNMVRENLGVNRAKTLTSGPVRASSGVLLPTTKAKRATAPKVHLSARLPDRAF